MFRCRPDSEDVLLRALLKCGMNIVLPPAPDLLPGQIVAVSRRSMVKSKVARQRSFIRRLSASTLFKDFDDRILDARVGDNPRYLKFDVSDYLDIESGISLLARVFGMLGEKRARLNGKLSGRGGKRLCLRLEESIRMDVEWDKIERFVEFAVLKDLQKLEKDMLFFVSTAYFARKLSVSIEDASGRYVEMEGDAEEFGEGDLSLTMRKGAAGEFEFESDQPLGFGVALVELVDANSGKVELQGLSEPMRVRGGVGGVDTVQIFGSEDVFLDMRG